MAVCLLLSKEVYSGQKGRKRGIKSGRVGTGMSFPLIALSTVLERGGAIRFEAKGDQKVGGRG